MNYYINTVKNSRDEHEIHHVGCSRMPHSESRQYLGNFNGCVAAILTAKKLGYQPVNGCEWCCRGCYKQ